MAAFEIVIANHPVRNLIREGKSHQIRNVMATSLREGMQTMEVSLNSLVQQGLVSYEDAVRAFDVPERDPPAGDGRPRRPYRLTHLPRRARPRVVGAPRPRSPGAFSCGGRRSGSYWAFWPLNTPYIAETRATATKPTTTPMKMMIAGSASDVSFFSL